MSRPFYIIGFMGTGKSSLKRYLETTNHVIDLDEVFERRFGTDIGTYFACHGEAAFRHRETELLRTANADFIVTGGGVVERAENLDWMLRNGTVVALDLSFETCWERIRHSNRPLVKRGKDSVRALYERRRPLYAQAHLTMDASIGTAAIADKLYRLKEEDK
ncbi:MULTISPECIES: shikimate kinase [Exiguobacterium]|uniref:Shikimate kinase n=1 Tax=Exiguobacterium aurantiacum TaxID=33987 RepID=A0A377FSS8_9BACL|nr:MULTISPECIES: shikimate kinase [Exiguobacterium]STO07870.1 Shikimate kinase [Exiguobacterium aurantiacum]